MSSEVRLDSCPGFLVEESIDKLHVDQVWETSEDALEMLGLRFPNICVQLPETFGTGFGYFL